jgi:hypothetical protein
MNKPTLSAESTRGKQEGIREEKNRITKNEYA